MGRGIQTIIDGEKFSSELEAWAFLTLRDMNLKDFKLHPRYTLFPKGNRQIINDFPHWNGNSQSVYTADFSYRRRNDDELIVVEAKPNFIKATDPFRLRCRVFLHTFPDLSYTIMGCNLKQRRVAHKPLSVEELYFMQVEGQIQYFDFGFHWYLPEGTFHDDTDVTI